MTSFAKLLAKIADLPEKECGASVPIEERVQEMELIRQVLPEETEAEWSSKGVEIRKACSRDDESLRMRFRIKNGSYRDVYAVYCLRTTSVSVFVDGKPFNTEIETPEALLEVLTSEAFPEK